ncbi:hypothetical protein U1Q18_051270, partial [Sarracenia purpurea var. burkii]
VVFAVRKKSRSVSWIRDAAESRIQHCMTRNSVGKLEIATFVASLFNYKMITAAVDLPTSDSILELDYTKLYKPDGFE